MKIYCQNCNYLKYMGRTDFQCGVSQGGRKKAYCGHPAGAKLDPKKNGFIGYLNDFHSKNKDYLKLTPSCKSWCPLKNEV